MQIRFNELFKDLLTKYNLTENIDYHVDIPTELQKLIDSSVIDSEYGITLEKLNNLHKITETWETVSIIEDFENHFHIDSFLESDDEKTVFLLGVKTLHLLSLKFINENYKQIRFTYSFQTPDQAEQQSRRNGFHEDNDNYFISDRLSFHRKRKGEMLLDDLAEYQFEAVMTIDI